MTEIQKRLGNKESFDIRKIQKSIQKAYVDGGIDVIPNDETIEDLTEEIICMSKGEKDITTKVIRKKILEHLAKTKKTASQAWNKFERKYKKDFGVENTCPYCNSLVEHDGEDIYVQCSTCGEISKYQRKKLRQTNIAEMPI